MTRREVEFVLACALPLAVVSWVPLLLGGPWEIGPPGTGIAVLYGFALLWLVERR